MSTSGTRRVNSADEDYEAHVNSYTVLTDPNILTAPFGGITLDGIKVSRFPRHIQLNTAALVPDAGTGAYQEYNWETAVLVQDTFPATIVSTGVAGLLGTNYKPLTRTDYVTFVTGSPTHLHFPKGGLWHIEVYAVYGNDHATVDTMATIELGYSQNSGGTWNIVGRGMTTIPGAAGAVIRGTSASFLHYFGELVGANTAERFRVRVAATQAFAAGIFVVLKATLLKKWYYNF